MKGMWRYVEHDGLPLGTAALAAVDEQHLQLGYSHHTNISQSSAERTGLLAAMIRLNDTFINDWAETCG